MLSSTIQIFFVSTNITFNESESYFLTLYIQGENSIKEDKYQDFYFSDPFLIDLIDPLKVFDPVSIPLIDRIDPPKVSDPVSLPYFEPKSSIEPTPKN